MCQKLTKLLLLICLCFSLETQADGRLAPGFAALERGQPKTAARSWQMLADQGVAEAQNALALLYQQGSGVPKDVAKALQLLTDASAQGLSIAKYNLGLTYYEGIGVKIDYGKAITLFLDAANDEIAAAQYMLAVIFFMGHGTDPAIDDALHWLNLAARQNYPEAQLMLAQLYLTTISGEVRLKEAYIWGTIAYENGMEEALAVTHYIHGALTKRQTSAAEQVIQLCRENVATCNDRDD